MCGKTRKISKGSQPPGKGLPSAILCAFLLAFWGPLLAPAQAATNNFTWPLQLDPNGQSTLIPLRVPIHSFPAARGLQSWENSDLSLEDLDLIMYGDIHAQGREQARGLTPLGFVARTHVVSALLFYTPFRLALISYQQRSRYPNAQIILNAHPFLLVVNDGLTSSGQIASLAERRAWSEYLLQLPNQADALPILFQIYEFAKSGIRRSSLEMQKLATIAGLNAWYQTFDPHARVLPVATSASNDTWRQNTTLENLIREIRPTVLRNPLGTRVGYLNLSRFDDMAVATIESIRRLESAGIAVLLLDVRENSGGKIDELVKMLSLFLHAERQIELFYVTPPNGGSERLRYFNFRSAETRLPIIVIQDHTTRSTAEAFSGVLQHYQRAWILGDQSFGKGTYMDSRRILDGRATLLETTGIMHLRDGTSPQITGIFPDFLVSPLPAAPRVANLYPNPLPRSPVILSESRRDPVARYEACADNIEREQRRRGLDTSQAFPEYFGDYQIFRAVILAHCLVGSP